VYRVVEALHTDGQPVDTGPSQFLQRVRTQIACIGFHRYTVDGVQIANQSYGPGQFAGQHGWCATPDIHLAESIAGISGQPDFAAQGPKILFRPISPEFEAVKKAERAQRDAVRNMQV
jgi:hypothetical protein